MFINGENNKDYNKKKTKEIMQIILNEKKKKITEK